MQYLSKLAEELEKLKDLLKCDLVTLHLYDSELDRIYFPLGIGLNNPKRFFPSVPSRKRVVGKIIREKKHILAGDALHHPDVTGPFTHIEKIKSSSLYKSYES